MADAANVADVVDANTAFVFAEIISNPKLVVPNIGELKSITTEHNIPLIIDATLTSSVGFNAKEHGVDVKFIHQPNYLQPMVALLVGLLLIMGSMIGDNQNVKRLKHLQKRFIALHLLNEFVVMH